MSKYVMSDIHGNWQMYTDILEQIDFENFGNDDKLYIVGDVVDREKSSIKILKHIMENRDKIEMIIGNHEFMMLTEVDKFIEDGRTINARENLYNSNWCLRNSGDETFEELMRETEEKQLEILDFVRNLPYKIELEIDARKFYLVHGRPEDYIDPKDDEVERARSLKYKPMEYQMVWGRFPVDAENESEATLVFGHTCAKYYKDFSKNNHWSIVNQKNYLAIDCGVAYKGEKSRLGCLRLDDMQEFYAKSTNDIK